MSVHVRRVDRRAILLPLLVFGLAACSGSGDPSHAAAPADAMSAPPSASAASATPIPASPASSAVLSVNSSIKDGAALDGPVEWRATVAGLAPSDTVNHVDFVLDGTPVWTEHNDPYTFNDDGNLLMPWVLDPGSHTLGINVTTVAGTRASTQLTVTTTRYDVPADLLGTTWSRTMDAINSEGPDGSPSSSPAGVWTITFGEDGLVTMAGPTGEAFNEGFHATPDGALTLFGQANWIVPADQRRILCGLEYLARLQWKVEASTLTMRLMDSDQCGARSDLFGGTWTAVAN